MSETRFQIDRLIEIGRCAEARRMLQRVFANAPHDPDAHVQAARIAFQEDDNDLAEEHLASALSSNPAHYDARFLRHLVLADRGHYAESEQILLTLIRENPANADLLAFYGRLMMITANLEKARALVSESLRLEPENHQARIVSVMLATIAGERQVASEQLSDLIRTDPECRYVAHTLFAVLVDENRHREAFRVGQQLLRADPDNEALVEALVELRVSSHWMALPLYPLKRWGWAGSAGMWIGFIIVLGLLRSAPVAGGALAITYLGWVIYSWTYPPLMKRWVAWRGVS